MKLGEVFYWVTEKVKDRDSRPKFHVYICAPDGWDEHTFLLINKASWGNELQITQAEYPFLKYDSYIGCNGVVSYNDAELATFEQKPVGQISAQHLKDLFNI